MRFSGTNPLIPLTQNPMQVNSVVRLPCKFIWHLDLSVEKNIQSFLCCSVKLAGRRTKRTLSCVVIAPLPSRGLLCTWILTNCPLTSAQRKRGGGKRGRGETACERYSWFCCRSFVLTCFVGSFSPLSLSSAERLESAVNSGDAATNRSISRCKSSPR